MSELEVKFPSMQNDALLRCIQEYMTIAKPIWFMRQNSVHLPEMKEFIDTYGYLKICRDPELAAKATLIPVKRFKLDGAVVFTHTMFLAEALGMKVVFKPDPEFLTAQPLTVKTVQMLSRKGAMERLNFIAKVITTTRIRLDGIVPLIGFTAGPWTLMCYMVEGRISDVCPKTRKFFYEHKGTATELMDMLTEAIADYCILQARAGVQAIQILDTAAKCMGRYAYTEFCIPRLQRIRWKVRMELTEGNIKIDCPMGVYAKGVPHALKDLANAGYEFLTLDHKTEPSYASKVLSDVHPRSVCLQGNFNPNALCVNSEDLKILVHKLIKKFGLSRFIISFGEDIFRQVPLEAIEGFIEAVRTNNDSKTSINKDGLMASRRYSRRSSTRSSDTSSRSGSKSTTSSNARRFSNTDSGYSEKSSTSRSKKDRSK